MIEMNIIANEVIDTQRVKKSVKIIEELQDELKTYIKKGYGPFLAAVYDENDNLIAKEANSVVKDNCCICHAEMNVIKAAQKKYNSYDLSPYNLKLYVTSEPCIMCLGGILWSGIKELYYGVPSRIVEEITGFDEGFKPNWLSEFKKRNILVYGNILPECGINVLKKYVNSDKVLYKPSR